MYYVTNYDSQTRIERTFWSFNTAKKAYDKWNDKHAVIEYFDKYYNRKFIYGNFKHKKRYYK